MYGHQYFLWLLENIHPRALFPFLSSSMHLKPPVSSTLVFLRKGVNVHDAPFALQEQVLTIY